MSRGGATVSLCLVRPLREEDVDLEAGREDAEQLGADREPDERRHRAVLDRRREADDDPAPFVVDGQEVRADDLQLLKRERRVLRVLDVADVLFVSEGRTRP